MARTGTNGAFTVNLPVGVHDFGILSPDWHLSAFAVDPSGHVRMTVVPAFPDVDPLQIVRNMTRSVLTMVKPLVASAGEVQTSWASSVGKVVGTVFDETGVAIAGVRILAVDERKQALVSVAASDAQGRYELVTYAGPNRLFVYAPGLLLNRSRRPAPGTIDFILTVDARVEGITIRSGRVLSFRMEDSMMPEVYPPAVVATTLQQDYGIDFKNCFCPGDLVNTPPPTPEQRLDACKWSAGHSCSRPSRCPLTVWARQCKVPRYWWLRLLQLEPPNPTLRESQDDVKTMWWYDTIRAMQESDARAPASKIVPR
jgi:hypothetical protein